MAVIWGSVGVLPQKNLKFLVFLGHDFLNSGTYLSECFGGKFLILG